MYVIEHVMIYICIYIKNYTYKDIIKQDIHINDIISMYIQES